MKKPLFHFIFFREYHFFIFNFITHVPKPVQPNPIQIMCPEPHAQAACLPEQTAVRVRCTDHPLLLPGLRHNKLCGLRGRLRQTVADGKFSMRAGLLCPLRHIFTAVRQHGFPLRKSRLIHIKSFCCRR